ncbi:RNase adapter RapZ, partial [Klebsiella quasipneumoniae]|uniref:RNase adapter RapZ n=2 Tax=Enterobacterales TaxID=91347 RepID=UPI00272FDB80
LLLDFLQLEQQRGERRVAIAVDVRSAGSLPLMLPLLKQLRASGVPVRSIFLDASNEALMRRFSETRRPHPLREDRETGFGDLDGGAEDKHRLLLDAIQLERE